LAERKVKISIAFLTDLIMAILQIIENFCEIQYVLSLE
jgi:hypothetical protein